MSAIQKNSLNHIKRSLSRSIMFSVFILAIFFAASLFFLQNIYLESRANAPTVIDPSSVASATTVEKDNKTTQFLIESKPRKKLFQLKNRDTSTILSTMSRGIRYAETQGGQAANVLPDNIVKTAQLKRHVDDTQDGFLKKRGSLQKYLELKIMRNFQKLSFLKNKKHPVKNLFVYFVG